MNSPDRTKEDLSHRAAGANDRHDVEQRLHDEQQRLALAMEAAELGHFELNLLTGAMLCSDRYKANFGLAPTAEVSYETLLQMILPEDRERVRGAVHRALAAGGSYDVEYRCRWPDESIHWLAARGRMVSVEGRPTRIIGVNRDFTRRRNAEDALRRSQRQLQLITDGAAVAIAHCSAERRFLFVNRTYAARLGLKPEEIIGRPLWDVLGKQAYDVFLPYVEQVLTGRHVEFEVLVPYKAIGPRMMNCRYVPEVAEDGSINGWIAVVNDVTERRRVEDQLAAANKAKDDFLATLSHELRTPLAPVLIGLQSLERDPCVPDHMRHDLEMMRINIELEARLIDDLLDLTRISRGKLQIQPQAVDVHLLLKHAMRTCEDEAHQKGQRVRLIRSADQALVWGDPARLEQVFWNLLKNAIKFTPEGGSIDIRTSNQAADRLLIEVVDTGIGIESALLPHVFDAFEQGGASTTRRFGGLGLGLAICKAITSLHNGQIEATSEGRGRGAIFAVTLPTTVRQTKPTDAPMDEPQGHRPLRVLLVEDHEHTARVLRRLLEASDHRVETARCVAEALEAANHESFDLVISDLGLPDGTGHELMRQLQGRYGLRGIALSGYGMEEDLERSRSAGFSHHLVKPVSVQNLEAAIRRATSNIPERAAD